MLDNSTFYPTPKSLIRKMCSKVEGHPERILEPSAGKGDIIKAYVDIKSGRWGGGRGNWSVIEIDPDLQATLEGKGYQLIDTDFLNFSGPDKFDLIIANPPFDKGAEHLLKAIDIMYSGQIVFLLNAETIKNPYSRTRQALKTRLDELGAEIEYMQDSFITAERSTGVEIALVYINIERKIETDLFDGVSDAVKDEQHEFKDEHSLMTGETVKELVAEYNKIITAGTDTILYYFKNFRSVGKYLALGDIKSRDHADYSESALTDQMQGALNKLLSSVREDFWRRTLDIKEVRNRLTSSKRDEFEATLAKRCHMDFTESNIRQFVLNMLKGHEQTLTEAVLDIFDIFTRHGYMGESVYEKNVHYFDGWKTNNAFKVGKRVIIPIYGSYGSPFNDSFSQTWKLNWGAKEKLNDIDIVMNYFDGMGGYVSIAQALEAAFDLGTNKASSTYFDIIAYKKGTIHLTFKDMGILRRFNMTACKGKGWLPETYGTKVYDTLTHEERELVGSFESKASYVRDQGKLVFQNTNPLQIEA